MDATTSQTDEPELRRYLRVLRSEWLLITITTLVVTALAVAGSLVQHKHYAATAQLEWLPSAATLATNPDPTRAVTTLVNLAGSDRVYLDAARSAGASADALKAATSVGAELDSNLIDFRSTADSAGDAATRANAVTKAFIAWRTQEQRLQLDQQIAALRHQIAAVRATPSPGNAAVLTGLRQTLAETQGERASANGDVHLVSLAQAPSAPYSPKPVRNAAIGFIVGLLLGILLAIVRDRLNRRLRTVEQIEQAYGLYTLGLVPRVGAAERNRSAGLGDYSSSSPLVEAFRGIRTNLTLLDSSLGGLHVIVVSSALPGEGKSAVTANLATSLAASGRRVLAISADLRAPSLHEYFGEKDGVGMLEVLAGEVSLAQATHRVPLNGAVSRAHGEVALLANDRRFPDPAMLFESPALVRLLDDARERFDVVLVDAPPLLLAGEAAMLARRSDTVLLVSQVDGLTRDDVRRVRARLAAAEITPLGLVITGVSEDLTKLYGYER
jgi:receptor protein-tyrosine kinase